MIGSPKGTYSLRACLSYVQCRSLMAKLIIWTARYKGISRSVCLSIVNNFLVLLYRKLKKKLRYSLVSLKFLSFKLANKMEFSFFERNFCADCRIENHLLRVSKAVCVLHFPLQARKLGEFLEKGNYWHLLLELPAKCMLAIPAEQLKIFFHRTYICPGLPASFLFLCTSFTLPNISSLFIHLKSTRNWGLLCLDKRTNELAMVV